jgi:hypothetical protein
MALMSGLCFLRFCFNFLLLHILFILRAGFYLNNLSSFWGLIIYGYLQLLKKVKKPFSLAFSVQKTACVPLLKIALPS